MSSKKAEAIFNLLAEQNPAPKSDLQYTNPYTLLVAVVLSAQATDKGVNAATAELWLKVKTPEEMLKLGEDGLKQYIKTIGLFNTKAKNIIALSKILVEKHGSKIPAERALLEELPGVGRKTANVVLNICFKRPVIAVDTHIFRTANRLGLSHGKTPLEVELQLEKATPSWAMLHAHHWLILHGRYVCRARKPECEACILTHHCDFYRAKPA